MKELKELKTTKDECAFTVRDEEGELTVTYTQRELRCLSGSSPLPEFKTFVQAIGIWDNFTVSAGMDTQAFTEKDRREVMGAAVALLSLLERDNELYQYTYEYKFPYSMGGHEKKDAHLTLPSGETAILKAGVPGQLFLVKQDGTLIDMRMADTIEVVACEDPYVIADLKLFKRKNHTRWVTHLKKLISFLELRHGAMVEFRHHAP